MLSPKTLSCRVSAARLPQMSEKLLFKHLQVLRPFHLSVPSPFSLGIELTANQCQSVNRSAVPLGCWVKEALVSCRNSCKCLDCTHQTLDFLTDFVSLLNCLNKEPPGFHGEQP